MSSKCYVEYFVLAECLMSPWPAVHAGLNLVPVAVPDPLCRLSMGLGTGTKAPDTSRQPPAACKELPRPFGSPCLCRNSRGYWKKSVLLLFILVLSLSQHVATFQVLYPHTQHFDFLT